MRLVNPIWERFGPNPGQMSRGLGLVVAVVVHFGLGMVGGLIVNVEIDNDCWGWVDWD